jgi:hypothetical protein
LAIKEEPAGKVRVFAMVDCFTQWALRPIHDFFFKKLALRNNIDGTFNQLAPLKRVPFGMKPIYSFDLSAATDRLPFKLQVQLLSKLFGDDISKLIKTILVDRDFSTPDLRQLVDLGISIKPYTKENYPSVVRYKVGQPMGAYTSWALLAVTHHLIIQHCAWTSGIIPRTKLFNDYSVLGDDIVIWNKTVAFHYLKVLKALGVEVGLAKSIISMKSLGLEFAKKTIVKGIDVSPIPLKDASAAQRRLSILTEFQKRYNLSDLQTIRFLGYGYKVDPTKVGNRFVRLNILNRSIPKTYSDFLSILQSSLVTSNHMMKTSWYKANMRFLAKTVNTELLVLAKLHKEVLELLTAMQVNGYPFHTKALNWYIPKVTSLSMAESLLSSISEAYSNLKAAKRYLDYPMSEVNSPLYPIFPRDYLWFPSSQHNASVENAIKLLFMALKIKDNVSVKDIFHPTMQHNANLSVFEERNTLRLWNR